MKWKMFILFILMVIILKNFTKGESLMRKKDTDMQELERFKRDYDENFQPLEMRERLQYRILFKLPKYFALECDVYESLTNYGYTTFLIREITQEQIDILGGDERLKKIGLRKMLM